MFFRFFLKFTKIFSNFLMLFFQIFQKMLNPYVSERFYYWAKLTLCSVISTVFAYLYMLQFLSQGSDQNKKTPKLEIYLQTH